MKKDKIYFILYYISFALTILINVFITKDGLMIKRTNSILSIINILFALMITFLIYKKQLDIKEILIPILYIVFLILMLSFMYTFNDIVIIDNMHYGYYLKFINIGLVLLNIYTLSNKK